VGAASLSKGVLTTMKITSLKWAAGLVLALSVAGGGAGVAASRGGGGGGEARDQTLDQLLKKLHEAELKIEQLNRNAVELEKKIVDLTDKLIVSRANDALRAADTKIRGRAQTGNSSKPDPNTTSTDTIGVGTSGGNATSGTTLAGTTGNGVDGVSTATSGNAASGSSGIASAIGMMGSGSSSTAGGLGAGGMMGGAVTKKGTDQRGQSRGSSASGSAMGGPGGMMRDGMAGMGGMGGGGMGGMGGMGGGRGDGYIRNDAMFCSGKLQDGKIEAYSVETGKWKTYQVPADVESATPIMASDVLALMLVGPKVTRIAAFDAKSGEWYSQELREPTTKAVPIVSNDLAAYSVGRFAYAFSSESHKWGVLELEDGAEPQVVVGRRWVTVDNGSRLHVFSPKTGTWASTDTKESK
jgi:hypothetical protein